MSEIKRDQLLAAVIAGRGPAYLRGLDLSSLDLSNAGWLAEADLRNADLSNANLRRANMSKANLESANLHSANLLGANLDGANLLNAKATVANLNACKLRGANLKGARLVGANLVRADLEEADLDGADLEGANLDCCNLRKARLTNVKLKLANLEGADLTETILDTHLGKGDCDGAPGFHGTISSIRLSDLIQLGCLSHSNLDIEVHSNTDKGNIYIGMGRVLHAHTGEIEGEAALLRIFGWENGRFVTRTCAPGSNKVSIEKPFEQLLLQSLQLKDEKRYAGKYSGFVRKVREYIPVEARVSDSLIQFLGSEARKLNPSQKIEITDIFDPGDSEEILCSVTAKDEMFIAPLKILDLDRDHPLYGDLAELQAG
jgi:Pentapeptide repeats (8 copies)/Domain of unknown function (DUF4388)